MFSIKVLAGAALALGITVASASAQVVVSSKIDTEGGAARQHHPAGAEGQRHQDAPTGSSSAPRRWCARRSPPARSTSIRNIPATPPSSSTRPTIRSGRMPRKAYEAAKKLDYDANKIVWLTPSPANNTWAIGAAQGCRRAQQARDLVRLRQVGRRRRQGRAGGLGRVRQLGGGAAGLPDDLWLHAEAGPADHAVRRRHGGDHRGGGRTRPTASTPPWSTAPTAALRRPASSCSTTTRACSRSTSRRRSSARRC